jgi:hypothetical protein
MFLFEFGCVLSYYICGSHRGFLRIDQRWQDFMSVIGDEDQNTLIIDSQWACLAVMESTQVNSF